MGIDIATAITHKGIEAVEFYRLAVDGDDGHLATLNPLAASRQKRLHGISRQARTAPVGGALAQQHPFAYLIQFVLTRVGCVHGTQDDACGCYL